MKKLIIVLMVVAMASFLFTGCLKGVTTDTTTDTTTTTVTVPATKAPTIYLVSENVLFPAAVIDLTSTVTQYVNKVESTWGIIIHGTAPTYSEVKVYLDGIVAGTADTLAGSTWSCVITLSELGKDGVKTVYATAIEPGCTESKKSNEVKFTLDRTPPKMASVAAYFAAAHYKVGFSEDVNIDVDVSAAGTPASALNPLNWSAAMAAAPNTIFGLEAATVLPLVVGDVFTAVSTRVIKIDPGLSVTPLASNPIVGPNDSYALFCWNIVDVAGNPIAGAPTNLALHLVDTTVVLDRSTAVIYSVTLP